LDRLIFSEVEMLERKKIAINGFGRIGRNFLRAYFENSVFRNSLEIVGINDVGSLESLAHLLQYDSCHGRFVFEVEISEHRGERGIRVDKEFIPFYSNSVPDLCPWKVQEVDWVLESTGCFRSRELAGLHLEAGAKKVLITAVAFDEVDATVVFGMNEESLKRSHNIVSAASCTTHCIAPLLKIIDSRFDIESVLMTEIHSYTSDQHILDHAHRDLRRARAGAHNIIPTTSSSIGAIQKIFPEIQGKIIGHSIRVPVVNVAAVDLNFTLNAGTDIETVNKLFREKSDDKILAFSEKPLVSSDFNQCSQSAIFDATQTQCLKNNLKIFAWYDNEWAYVHRLLDLLCHTIPE